MKQIAIITPVPQIVEMYLNNSILRKAKEKELVCYHIVDLREFGIGTYRQVDDKPFGGGSGMVMMPEPFFNSIKHTFDLIGDKTETQVINPSPQGKHWTHETALQHTHDDNLIFLCGHYKGIDERVIEKYVTHEYSLGDFVVTGGELPVLSMVDSIIRLIPGVLNNLDSALTDSFTDGILDSPCYTRPQTIEGLTVPDVLVGGHHQEIEDWRTQQKKIRTRNRRPDMWEKVNKI